MGKFLSVIIPVHNKATTLPRVIESIREQIIQKTQIEIIFIVDNCTDESLVILQSLIRNDEARIIKTNFDKGSAAKARNLGLEIATGEYCLFLDADVVTPPNFFTLVTQYLRSSPSTVYFAPIYGNSGSISTWPFVVQNHSESLKMGNQNLMNWIISQQQLKDLRIDFADKITGSLDHLPAPWVFCWSSAMALEKSLITRVNGFNSAFRHKGSEDLELGYRLFNAGAHFKIMLDTYALHLPHKRNRDAEENNDRLHEREMLRLHPSREMEALCAFDGAHTNPMLDLLGRVDVHIIDELKMSWNISVDIKKLALPTVIPLVMGLTSSWLIDNIDFDYIVCPYIQPDEHRLPLFGLTLPFEDQTFTAAVLTGFWQLLPERIACRIIDEALRVASEVYLIKNTQYLIPKISWPSDLLLIHDAPYWERTHQVRRSFFDFLLTPLGEDGPICSFRVRRSAGGHQ